MPIIEIKTARKYEEAKKIKLLKEMDQALMEKLNLQESRFLINWSTMDPNSFLYKGINIREVEEEYPIVHIYSMEGKAREMEKSIMESIINVLVEKLNIDCKNITIIYHPINSGNIYAGGDYLV